MLMALTLLTLLSRLPLGTTIYRTCIPNSQFKFNDRICYCDGRGRWSEANCHINRRQTCQPGQIIWQGCAQCLCQDNGQMLCTNVGCEDTTVAKPRDIDVAGLTCTPFKSYYFNCSVCVCPASRIMSEARCASDKSCTFKDLHTPLDVLTSISRHNICIPNVVYLFPCIHCSCSDEGIFVINKCVETCNRPQDSGITSRCIPKTFYRKDCNVCHCPENSIREDKLCTQSDCKDQIEFQPLENLKNKSRSCLPHRFTKPKCFYCTCNSKGTINDKSCFELDCLNVADFNYDVNRNSCSPGEMVPVCTECFCLHTAVTNGKYCSNVCSPKSKLMILENILKNSYVNNHLVNGNVIKQASVEEICGPDTVYLDQGRYCLCPEDGKTNNKLCTTILVERDSPKLSSMANKTKAIDLTIACEPNTFVEFDCNTCYCAKNGKIDPKWCTYDDCDTIRVIQEFHKVSPAPIVLESTDICTPGSIFKINCNFCICPDNGLLKDKACTKNNCDELTQSTKNENLFCEPLAYYAVDCNICFCPRHGLKNVAKCTKNQCEKNFLRSKNCVAGNLFSDNCNVCICPPNGNKEDRVCTSHICSDADTPWKNIFKTSQSLLWNRLTDDTTRSLDLCFPGEEFMSGCKVCVCPDMGLREYATCVSMLCHDGTNNTIDAEPAKEKEIQPHTRREDKCITFTFTDSMEKKECTPGSMYIIRCRQCICPYMGNINNYCRPMPPGSYCEQAYPFFNYVPMGRRQEGTKSKSNSSKQITIKHMHTKHKCEKPGRIMDECFICTCENENVVIEEHCFRNDDIKCADVKPSFLKSQNKIVLG